MERYNVRILPSAYNDLKQARNWYKQHNPMLPQRFSQQVNLTVESMRKAPFTHAIRYKEVRIANLNIFPYAIHYLINEKAIIIIAIHHTAISPKQWSDRNSRL